MTGCSSRRWATRRSADVLFRLYRRLRPRNLGDEKPFESLRRTVEHEALIAFAARNVGLKTPRLRAYARAEPNGYVLAFEAIAGKSLDRLDRSDITDGVLAACWRMVGQLRHHRIAHRDLRLANIFVGDDSDVWLIDFGFSEMAASDLLLATDVAELIASSSLAVGPNARSPTRCPPSIRRPWQPRSIDSTCGHSAALPDRNQVEIRSARRTASSRRRRRCRLDRGRRAVMAQVAADRARRRLSGGSRRHPLRRGSSRERQANAAVAPPAARRSGRAGLSSRARSRGRRLSVPKRRGARHRARRSRHRGRRRVVGCDRADAATARSGSFSSSQDSSASSPRSAEASMTPSASACESRPSWCCWRRRWRRAPPWSRTSIASRSGYGPAVLRSTRYSSATRGPEAARSSASASSNLPRS